MEIKVKKQINNSQLEVNIEEKDDKEALALATVFMQPDICGKCGGNQINWEANKPKTDEGTFTYIKRRCIKCSASSTLGSYQSGGFFWKQWEIYEAPQQQQNSQQNFEKQVGTLAVNTQPNNEAPQAPVSDENAVNDEPAVKIPF